MKTPLCIALLLSINLVHAHDLWVASPDTLPAKQILHADLAYGDRYPHGSSIDPNRVTLFKPLEILGENGKRSTLKLTEDNYRYRTAQPLSAGTYHVLATYRPTFWLKDANGKWSSGQNLKQQPQATYCEQTQMFAKRLLVVGKQYDEVTATIPVGQLLEIVPLDNPTNIKAGDLLPVQVWYQGKPLAGATITATSDTLLAKDPDSLKAHREIQGYSARTDADGRVNFIPLIDGIWKLRVTHKTDFEDKTVCQQHSLYATYMLPVGEQSIKTQEPETHHHDHSHHDHAHHHHHH